MVQQTWYPLNTPFKPAPALRISLVINSLLLILFLAACVILPLVFDARSDGTLLVLAAGVLVLAIIIFLIWVQLYYNSMWYELRNDEMSWKRGVWFRTTGIVPYNRITNLDIRQGPVMRVLGISTIAIQTAGYSGQTGAEIQLEGMEHAGELREQIRSLVRSAGSSNDGTGTGADTTRPDSTDQKILGELVKIRLLLEQQKKD